VACGGPGESWVPTAIGARGSDIVKLQALEEELLNGLHDAMLRAISLDVVGQTAELQWNSFIHFAARDVDLQWLT
jgi:hypothetical protein